MFFTTQRLQFHLKLLFVHYNDKHWLKSNSALLDFLLSSFNHLSISKSMSSICYHFSFSEPRFIRHESNDRHEVCAPYSALSQIPSSNAMFLISCYHFNLPKSRFTRHESGDTREGEGSHLAFLTDAGP